MENDITSKSLFNIKFCNLHIVDMSISGLSLISSTRFVKLSWQHLTHVTNVGFAYEVAYITRPDNTECSGDLTTLPDGYTVYPENTRSDNIEVFGLIPGTCYAFGVRVHTSISDSPGEFTVIQGATVSEGATVRHDMIRKPYSMLKCLIFFLQLFQK